VSVALPLQAVRALAAAGDAPSLFHDQPVLVLDLAEGQQEGDHFELLPWLRRAGCPVLAVGEARLAPDVAAACDVHLPDVQAATPLVARIEQMPRAAAVLVHLLRQIEQLPLEAGLFAESLAYATLQSGLEYQRWLAVHRAPAVRVPTELSPAVWLRREGEAWHLTLDRASTQNAMSVEMRDALLAALAEVTAHPLPGGLQIDARGPCFSTGGELSEFGTVPDAPAGHLIRHLALPGRALAALADQTTVRVHGACIGSGIEFPAFAGRLEAAPGSVFELPEMGFGLIPGAGGCVSISRRIGRQRTAGWVLSGARIDAKTALDWGLVDALTG
jgi:enoyl-CoA hydratase